MIERLIYTNPFLTHLRRSAILMNLYLASKTVFDGTLHARDLPKNTRISDGAVP